MSFCLHERWPKKQTRAAQGSPCAPPHRPMAKNSPRRIGPESARAAAVAANALTSFARGLRYETGESWRHPAKAQATTRMDPRASNTG